MVIEFLNQLRSDYLNAKLDLESEEKNIEMKLNENEKIMKKFQEEEEKNFNAFSPRNKNSNLKDRINNLNQEREILSNQSEEVKKKIDHLDSKIDEIDTVLEDTNQRFMEKEKKENAFYESESSIALRNLYIQNLTSMLHKMDFCSRLIQIDPVRCRVELSSISKLIRETIDEIYMVDLKKITDDDMED